MIFGARKPFWFALGFVVGYQLLFADARWVWPL